MANVLSTRPPALFSEHASAEGAAVRATWADLTHEAHVEYREDIDYRPTVAAPMLRRRTPDERAVTSTLQWRDRRTPRNKHRANKRRAVRKAARKATPQVLPGGASPDLVKWAEELGVSLD